MVVDELLTFKTKEYERKKRGSLLHRPLSP